MEIDFSKTLSTIAIIISISAIIIARSNLKKQLRLSKLEEILEILQFMQGYYVPLFWLFHDTADIVNGKLNSNDLKAEMLQKRRDGFTEVVDRDNIIKKIARVRILANSYLGNQKKLKSKILVISDIYYAMYMFMHTKGEMPRREKNAIIPKPGEMSRFIHKIEQDIILEMNLGFKSLDQKTYNDYCKNQFKKDLEKKDTPSGNPEAEQSEADAIIL